MRQKARITVFCRIFHLIKNAIHNSFIRLTLTLSPFSYIPLFIVLSRVRVKVRVKVRVTFTLTLCFVLILVARLGFLSWQTGINQLIAT